MSRNDKSSKTLVLGIGNLLMGDEGVGPHAVRLLLQQQWPDHVEILDGGTGGFHLLPYLQNYPRVILIDATMDGETAGTIRVLRPKYASDFPRALSAHDIGLRDLIESAVITSGLPEIHLITVSIASLQGMCLDLSAEVASALPRVVSHVARILKTENSPPA